MKIKSIILGTILGVGLCCVAGGSIGMKQVIIADSEATDSTIARGTISLGINEQFLPCSIPFHSYLQSLIDSNPNKPLTLHQLSHIKKEFTPYYLGAINLLNTLPDHVMQTLCSPPTSEIEIEGEVVAEVALIDAARAP